MGLQLVASSSRLHEVTVFSTMDVMVAVRPLLVEDPAADVIWEALAVEVGFWAPLVVGTTVTVTVAGAGGYRIVQ